MRLTRDCHRQERRGRRDTLSARNVVVMEKKAWPRALHQSSFCLTHKHTHSSYNPECFHCLHSFTKQCADRNTHTQTHTRILEEWKVCCMTFCFADLKLCMFAGLCMYTLGLSQHVSSCACEMYVSLPSHTTVSMYMCVFALCPVFLCSLGFSGLSSLCFFCLQLLCSPNGCSVKQQRLVAKTACWFCVSTLLDNMNQAGAT